MFILHHAEENSEYFVYPLQCFVVSKNFYAGEGSKKAIFHVSISKYCETRFLPTLCLVIKILTTMYILNLN